MRYSGQGWEIPIALSEAQAMAPDAGTFQALFEADYTKLFGRPVAGLDVEITVWSVNATTPPELVQRIGEHAGAGDAPVQGTRRIFDPALGDYMQAQVVSREEMAEGAQVSGPAAITEDETTIILPSSRRALRQSDGCIDIRVKG